MVKEVQVLLLSLMNNTPNLWLKGRNYCIHLSPHLLFPRADIISLYMQMNLMEFNESLFTLYVGITTLVGGGTGPTAGTRATTCTPAPSQMKLMLQSTDDLPLNFGFTGKGSSSKPDELHEIIKAGAMGLKLHEDWGSASAAIDSC
ncbi:hypothetical protein GLYMA_08G102966v4 [Glycine max]|nr:hypothetical protein GLYMA_08G102966v4 [Glycine max]KAH1050535.1 hypothetical protein GYH30_020825 [Glycine max]